MMATRRVFRAVVFAVGIFCWCLHISVVSAQFVPSAWPQNTGAPVNSSPVLGDLNGDGMLEIVVGSDNNKVYAWKPDGTLMPGWPVTTGDSVRSSPALADIDGDGRLDVIVGSFDNKVYAWNFNGSLLPGWPAVTGSVVYSSPAVGDIDGDQLPEIVVGSFDNKVYAWNADGTLVREWPKSTGLFVYSSPALADLDGDRVADVIVGTDNNRVFAWKGDGTDIEGWPTATEHVVPSSPAVGDIDNDGMVEVVVGSWDKVFVWNSQGERKPGWPVTAGHQLPSSPALADLNNDGRLEIIIGCKDGRVYIWNATGQSFPGWPVVTDAEISASPAVADLNGDGRLEIIIGSKDNKVYIWDVEGRLFPGWPKTTGGTISSSPAVADLDGDGTLEVVIGSKDQNVYVWNFPRTGALTPHVVWQNFHGDPSHSGTYGFRSAVVAVTTPTPPPAPPAMPSPTPSSSDVRIIAAYPGATPQVPIVPQVSEATPATLPVTQQPVVPREIEIPIVPQVSEATPATLPVIQPVVPREIIEGYISDLVISDYEGTSVTLTWTTPPGLYSPRAVYDIRYSVQPITEDTWEMTMKYPTQIPPAASGSREVQHLTNLKAPDDRAFDMVYLAVKIVDENKSFPLSNVVRFERQDTDPPARIGDLKAADLNDALVELSWTAVGDDGNAGTAATYDLRYAEVPLNEMTWVRATQVDSEPAPLPAGTEQRFQVPKPWNDREIFWGMKVIDEALNISDLSEVAVWSPRDDIPPSRIVDLRVSQISGTTVTLTWTAPGNNLNVGKAARYDIRFSDFPMTDETEWVAATPAPNPPAPLEAGTLQSYQLQDIPIGETVFVGIKTIDLSENSSPLSNVIETAMDDMNPPAAVADLNLEQVGKDWAKLSWTATGDDDQQGAASAYILRYCGNVRVIRSWNEAIDVQELPAPSRAGTKETASISGLNENTTYYVGLRVLDDQGNSSEISNILRIKTLGYSTPAAVTDLVIEELRADSVTLNWMAPQDFGEESPQVNGYDIRYARTELTEDTWESAMKFTHSLSPSAPETLETLTLKGGLRDSDYYIALKSFDALGNVSALSNVVHVPQVETVAPDPILDLVVEDAGQDWIKISWTSTGDDQQQGQASAIQIRVAPSLNQLKKWDQAIEMPNTIQPAPAGMKDTFTLTGLKPDSIFFIAAKSVDEFGNTSELSNIVRANTKDAVPPAVITDLQISRVEKGEILLEWTATGEDGVQGQAKTYDIRFAQEPVTMQNWETIQTVSLVPRPASAGSRETLTISERLLPNTTYYFAMIVSDSSGNQSPLSNVVQVVTGDTIAPNRITTLMVETVDQTSVLLRWNSPGDDDLHDTPANYEIRYAQKPLTEASWAQATAAEDSPIPSPKGEREQFLLSDLQPNSMYYIGIKAIDTDENASELSNVVQIYTSKDVVSDLEIREFSSQAVTLTWTAPGGVLSDEQGTYDIRYATTRITEDTWDDATPVETVVPVNEPGQKETVELTDLPMYEQMFFAVRTLQQQPGPDGTEPYISELSNVVELKRLDVIAPAVVADLEVADLGDVSSGLRSLTLTWQAPGDNNEDGTAAKYDLRYGILPPTDENWDSLTEVEELPTPEIAGTAQHAEVQIPYQEDNIYFALRTFDEALNVGGISNIVQWSPEDSTPPAAVLDLAATRLSNGDIQVDWTAPGDSQNRGMAAFYDIRYALKEADIKKWDRAQVVPNEPLPEAADTRQEYLIAGLDPDKAYYIAMKTVDDAKNISDLSNIVEVSKVLPLPIEDLAFVENTDTSVTLSWRVPRDSMKRIVKYDIRYAEDKDQLEQWNRAERVKHTLEPGAPGASESIVVEKLTPSTHYYFAIRSIDKKGDVSELSDIVEITTDDLIIPGQIEDLALVENTDTTVTLSWKVPDEGAESIVKYDIRYTEEQEQLEQWSQAKKVKHAVEPGAPETTDSIMIEKLTPKTHYYFAVRSVDKTGNISELSNIVEVTTDDLIIPEQIEDLAYAGGTETTVTLSWTAPDDRRSGGRVVRYDIRFSEEQEALEKWDRATRVRHSLVPNVSGTTEAITVEALSPNSRYYFAIKSIDSRGEESLMSNIAAAYTTDTIPPNAVTDLAISQTTKDSATLSWTVQADDAMHDKPELYELRYSLEPIDEMTWANALVVESPEQALKTGAPGSLMSYTLDGLVENTQYYFAVRAIDGSGNMSGLSNLTIARTDDVTAPEAIADLQAMFPTPTSVLLAWTCPGDTPGSRAVSDEQGTPDMSVLSEEALVASYDIRYLEMPVGGTSLDEASWETAQKVLIPPAPLTPGTVQEFIIAHLEPAKAYTFAMKVIDRSGNISFLSNVAVETTLPEELTSTAVSQTRAISPSEGSGWQIVQGEQFADIHHDELGTMTIAPRNTTRALTTTPAVTVVYPSGDQQVSIRQGELVVNVKSAQDFLICAKVVATADGEAPYTLCYTPSEYLIKQAQTSEAQVAAQQPRKRIEQYVFYALDPSLADNEWHELRLNLAQDLLTGTGFLYQDAVRFSVRGVELSLKDMSMQGEVLSTIDDFEKGVHPLETGWKLHFGAGLIQLTQDTVQLSSEGTTSSSVQQSNTFLYAKSETDQALVLTYPRDASAALSDKPIFVANVKVKTDFKIILKTSTKDQREYYLAYVPEAEFHNMTSSGNYIYMPLPAVSASDQSGWVQIRASIAEDLRKNQLEYDHTSWISFHGKEFSIDNVGFSTERLETELK